MNPERIVMKSIGEEREEKKRSKKMKAACESAGCTFTPA